MIEVEVKDLFQGAVFSATPRLYVFEGGHHSGKIDKFKSLLRKTFEECATRIKMSQT